MIFLFPPEGIQMYVKSNQVWVDLHVHLERVLSFKKSEFLKVRILEDCLTSEYPCYFGCWLQKLPTLSQSKRNYVYCRNDHTSFISICLRVRTGSESFDSQCRYPDMVVSTRIKAIYFTPGRTGTGRVFPTIGNTVVCVEHSVANN